MTYFSDIANMTENDRIRVIGLNAVNGRKIVGFVVEDREKADRYVQKLLKRFPGIEVVEITPGPVDNTILVKVGPKGVKQ